MASKLVNSRARPVRIAYLIEQGEHWEKTLDAIFACSFGYWGGRFSLIVPCEGGCPKQTYYNWLEKFDPDVIYSYVNLDRAVIETLHERLYPSFLIRHQIFEHQEVSSHTLRPNLPIDPLSISTLVPLAAGPVRFEPPQPTRVLDTMGSAREDRFIQDNFGSWLESVGSSYPAILSQYGHILTTFPKGEIEHPERYIRPPDEAVNSKTELLSTISTGRFSSPSGLSAMAAPRLEINNSQWGEGFNIIVGDSFTDRIVYWNARSHLPKWLDSSVVDIRIPTAVLDDPILIGSIGHFLKHRNRVTIGSGGTPRVVIRSSTVSVPRLQALAEVLKTAHTWAIIEVRPFATVDDCVPSEEQLTHSHFAMTEGFLPRASMLWSETLFQQEEVRISPPSPEHLRFAPAAMQSPHVGAWAVDLDIDRETSHSQYDNVMHRWLLPRRLRMTPAFVRGYEMENAGRGFVMPRVSAEGFLTVYATNGSKFPTVRQPDDEMAFRKALVEGRDWYPFQHSQTRESINQLCRGVARSENGRYFWGVLQMFGSLNAANKILLNQFWRTQFDKLGASSSPSQVRRSVVEQTLKKKFRTKKLDFQKQDEADRLTNIVLQEAEHYRTFVPLLSWTELEDAFKQHQDQYWKTHPASGSEDDELEWREHEFESFTEEVRELCRTGILYQGFEHRCGRCFHRSWIGIDAVKKEFVCEVCGTSESAPVDRPWEFRLNEFMREALRKHGVLPLFWTLSKLRDFREKSFFFEGPLDIYFDLPPWEASGPDGDVDLICVSNGRVFICEVKQSARQLRKTGDFSTVISRLRPDVGIIAVMESMSPEIQQAFRRFSLPLVDSGIETRLITLEQQDFSDML
jgi:hypothetical protein